MNDGSYTSRRDTFDEDGTFYVQDTFGVYGGIYPRDRRFKFFDELDSKNFVTVAQSTHMTIRCTSDRENAFLEPENYHLQKRIPKELNRYEYYIYE